MAKYVIGENKEAFDIEDALTISKGEWADGNLDEEDRLYRFVTASNDGYKVNIADKDSYICGVTVKNDSFLGSHKNDPKYCVVQSLGVCVVEDAFGPFGKLKVGDKCMPNVFGQAVSSDNNLGYRVVERVDENHVKIIMSPNNDMVQRIKQEMNTKVDNTWTNIGLQCVFPNGLWKTNPIVLHDGHQIVIYFNNQINKSVTSLSALIELPSNMYIPNSMMNYVALAGEPVLVRGVASGASSSQNNVVLNTARNVNANDWVRGQLVIPATYTMVL